MTTIDNHLSEIIRDLIRNGITLDQALDVFEGKFIAIAMDENDHNVTRASKALGIHRNTLHNKLRNQSAVSAYVARLDKGKRRKKRGSSSKKKK
ncbi:MAG: helix-turn-helix domain-containing protein [Thermoanaerobaculia bacterium]|nr:helix-turn-helix domain-containing protein [Thermoanaerobaculia bacterium]